VKKILAINGSYRDDGITDQAVEELVSALRSLGANTEVILLRDYPIEFCLNCRECTQKPGDKPGQCIQTDKMHELIEKIEQADAYILASPTNFSSVTALFKRFMERLIVYAYWPWGANAPIFRKKNVAKKKAILITSSAAPALLGRYFFYTTKQLKMTAKTIGADTVGTLFTGLASMEAQQKLPERSIRKIQKLASKLL